MPSSEESPPEEEGDDGGGEGGIPDPPAAGFKIGSEGFTVRLVSPNCSLMSEKFKGRPHGRFGCLKLAKEICVLIRDRRKISSKSPPVGLGVAGSTVICGSSVEVVVV